MKHAHASVVVKRSSAGLGLFANTIFKRGDFIIEYIGEHISYKEADRRDGKYLFTVSDTVVIDGKGRENIARYINHSCVPNAEAEADENDCKIRVFAKKTIHPTEEITLDYGKEYTDRHIKPHGCRCSSCTSKKLD